MHTSQKKYIPLLVLIITIFLWNGIGRVYLNGPDTYGQGDFAIFYSAAYALTHDINPYQQNTFKKIVNVHRPFDAAFRYLYPPTAALVFIPFLVFEPATAAHIWVLCTLLFLFLIALYTQQLIRKKFTLLDWSVITALCAVYGPFITNTRLGQVNILLAFFFVLHLLFIQKKRVWLGSLFLAAMILFKIFPAILLVYYVCTKQWKVVATTLASVGLLLTVSIMTVGPSVHVQYIDRLQHLATGGINSNDEAASYDNASFSGAAERFITRAQGTLTPSPAQHNVIRGMQLFVTVLMFAGACVLTVRSRARINPLYGTTLWLAIALFTATEIHTQYFVLFLPAFFALYIRPPTFFLKPLRAALILACTVLFSYSFMRFLPKAIHDSFLTAIPLAFIAQCVFLGLMLYYMWYERD